MNLRNFAPSRLAIVPPWDNGHGLTVWRIHQSRLIQFMMEMEAAGFGGYAEISLVEPEAYDRKHYADLTYDLRVPV